MKHLPAPAASLTVLLAAAALLFVPTARAQEGWVVIGSFVLERAKAARPKLTSAAGPKLTSVLFLDDRRGVLVGNAGLVRVTRNGGVTWSMPQFDQPFTKGIDDDIQRVVGNRKRLLLVSSRFVLISRDGGERWATLRLPTVFEYKDFGTGPLSTYFYDASMVDEDAWVLGAVFDARGDVFKGNFVLHYDLGKDRPAPKLTRLDPEEVGTEFLRVFFVNHDNGWVVGTKGALLKSDDGGSNWRPPGEPMFAPTPPPGVGARSPNPSKPNLNGVYFINSDKGWVVGDNGMTFFSEDGGESWKPGNFMAGSAAVKKANLKQVQFINKNKGWAIGSAGTVIRTVDGGRTWTPELLPKTVTKTLFAVEMLNESTGWVVGDGDTILRYDAPDPDKERGGSQKFRERTTGRPNEHY